MAGAGKKKSKVQLVEVRWLDAQDLPGEEAWVSWEDIKKNIDSLTDREHSTGYLLGEYKGFIILASTKTKKPENGQDWYSAVQLIPAGWVEEIKVVK